MGPSGSGKSTLLNVLGLLDEPSTGEYRLDGQPTAGLSERARSGLRAYRIGFVFQAFHLVGVSHGGRERRDRTAYQKVRREGAPAAGDRRARAGRADRAHVGDADADVGRRAPAGRARPGAGAPAGARACDEPTGNLDTATGEQVLELIDELHDEGLTVVVITHDPEVGQRAQRIVEIRDGVVHDGVVVVSGDRVDAATVGAQAALVARSIRDLRQRSGGRDHPPPGTVAAHRARHGRRRRRVRRHDRAGVDGQGAGQRALRRARGDRGAGGGRRAQGAFGSAAGGEESTTRSRRRAAAPRAAERCRARRHVLGGRRTRASTSALLATPVAAGRRRSR